MPGMGLRKLTCSFVHKLHKSIPRRSTYQGTVTVMIALDVRLVNNNNEAGAEASANARGTLRIHELVEQVVN